MKKNQDAFIKLNVKSKHQSLDVEMAHESDPITQLEISRIKAKVERKWLNRNR